MPGLILRAGGVERTEQHLVSFLAPVVMGPGIRRDDDEEDDGEF